MPQLIIVIICIYIAVQALGLMLAALIISLPALAVSYATMHFYKRYLIKSLSSSSVISKVVSISIDGRKLAYKISEPDIEKYSSAYNAVVYSVAVFAVTWCITVYLASYFTGSSWKPKDGTEVFFAVLIIICTFVVFIVFINKVKVKLDFGALVTQEADRLLSKVNFSLQRRIEELIDILQEASALSQKLNIVSSEDSIPSIYRYIDSNKSDILENTEALESLIDEKIVDAKVDLTEIKRASNTYDQVMQLYYQVVTVVNQVGHPSMAYMLDQLLIGLEGLKSYLSKKEWQRFHNGIEYVSDKLNLLLQNASNDPASAGVEDVESEPMDPYEILHVPKNITEGQLIQFWKRMKSIYHPDKGIINEDEDRHYIKMSEAVKKIAELRGFEISKY